MSGRRPLEDLVGESQYLLHQLLQESKLQQPMCEFCLVIQFLARAELGGLHLQILIVRKVFHLVGRFL